MIDKHAKDSYQRYAVETLLGLELEIKSRYGRKAEVDELRKV